MEVVGTRTWATTTETLHDEGFPHRFASLTLRKEVVDVCPSASAFAFAHESIYDAIAPIVPIEKAIEQILELKRGLSDPDRRSMALGKLLVAAENVFLFGTDQHRSSAARDGIGHEILVEAFDKALMEIEGLPGDDLGRAGYLLTGIADLSAFEATLDLAGATLQPSISGSCVPSVRETIAAMSIEISAMRTMENDVESDKPTPAVQDMADLAARLKIARDDADRRQRQFMARMGYS